MHNMLKQEAKDHFTKCTIQWIVIYPVDSVIHPEQLGPGRLKDSFENTPSWNSLFSGRPSILSLLLRDGLAEISRGNGMIGLTRRSRHFFYLWRFLKNSNRDHFRV